MNGELINQVKENVSNKAFVMTDEHFAYRHLKEQGFFHHYMVEHGNREYVRGKIHTQTIKGIKSHLSFIWKYRRTVCQRISMSFYYLEVYLYSCCIPYLLRKLSIFMSNSWYTTSPFVKF